MIDHVSPFTHRYVPYVSTHPKGGRDTQYMERDAPTLVSTNRKKKTQNDTHGACLVSSDTIYIGPNPKITSLLSSAQNVTYFSNHVFFQCVLTSRPYFAI